MPRYEAPTDAVALLLEWLGVAIGILAVVGGLALVGDNRSVDGLALGGVGVALGAMVCGIGRCVRYLQRQVEVSERNLRLLRELAAEEA